MRTANVFIDPRGGRASFPWPVNHEKEEKGGKQRNITTSAPTSNIGLIREINASSPVTLTWKGKIFTRAHLQEMWAWWQLNESQTIYLQDFAGDTYEVIIEEFDPVRIAVARNLHDPTHAPTWMWEYTLQFTVLQLVSGVMHDAGVTV